LSGGNFAGRLVERLGTKSDLINAATAQTLPATDVPSLCEEAVLLRKVADQVAWHDSVKANDSVTPGIIEKIANEGADCI